MFRFQHVEYLWLLLLLPFALLLYISFLKWRRNKIKKLGDPQLVHQLFKGKIDGRSTTQFVLLMLALASGIIAMANLQTSGQAQKVERKGIDVFFALDVSKSMLAKDVSPDRISSAKQLILRMVDKMKNDRVGLVVFAGKAYLQVPLTIDYSAMKMLLSTVQPGSIPTQGTVLADAINLSTASFKENDNKHKVIIIISDGEDHDSQAMDAVKKAMENGALIYTVGVGSAQGSTIFDPGTGQDKVDENGETVITKLNEKELQNLASVTGGTYQLLTNANQVAETLIAEIGKMETKSLGEVVFKNYKSYFQYFLTAALIFLLAGWFLPSAATFTSTLNYPKKEK